MKKLNLGCGNDIRQGYINLDVAKLQVIRLFLFDGRLRLGVWMFKYSFLTETDEDENLYTKTIMIEYEKRSRNYKEEINSGFEKK
ncbi:hypothetical protein COU57_01915 [Candidatus Pacearchaeota archaeon CG10_big_fil_rev_8_21_14_0_10_32_14]|nr:MAG: hypothetical protein COU57_01915 [Candidatus Pacearchaeota archaeon CG10_big_fil_rev_8_21_14_0_10_32_14]